MNTQRALGYYFHLQWQILQRHIRDLGVMPIIVFILLPILFAGATVYLFQRISWAAPLYTTIAVVYLGGLSERSRNEFLNNCFTRLHYLQIRSIENILVMLPFIVGLCVFGEFWWAVGLFIIGSVMVKIGFVSIFNWSIPTPFRATTHEGVTGFRQWLWVILGAYLLAGIGAYAHNINIAYFSLLLLMGITVGYYAAIEHEVYIWVYDKTPRAFLRHKIIAACIHYLVPALPIIIGLTIINPETYKVSLLLIGMAWLIITSVLVIKYAIYPQPMNIVHSIIMALCLSFPPLTLVVIPIFYRKSLVHLRTIL